MNIPYGTGLVATLGRMDLKIVFAESCTAGLAAATLAKVPGVSSCLCGSAVTYRIDTKSQWLGVDSDFVETHTAESPEVSLAMAIGVLERTPEADLAAAITGHLGPHAPPEKDGVVYVAIARRNHQGGGSEKRSTSWKSVKLSQSDRCGRQLEAAKAMIDYVDATLRQDS